MTIVVLTMYLEYILYLLDAYVFCVNDVRTYVLCMICTSTSRKRISRTSPAGPAACCCLPVVRL